MAYDVTDSAQDLLIDGKRVPAASGRYFETLANTCSVDGSRVSK